MIMKRITSVLLLIAVLLTLTRCEPSVSERTPVSGEADFTSYVALGNSLTAGYTNNALYREGQKQSIPNILAGQMKEAGGGEFLQPLVSPGVGSNADGEARLMLHLVTGPDGEPDLAPAPAAQQGDPIFQDNLEGPFHNLGVPGARSYHLLAEGYGNPQAPGGNFNPFYTRFMSSPTASVVSDAMAADPTFFTLWVGNNDVLGYATNGGTGVDHGDMAEVHEIAGNDITARGVFNASVDGILGNLTAHGAQGAVLNIPDITNIPFFTTVPSQGLMLSAEQAQMLRAAYEAEGVPEPLIPDFQPGQNGFIIEDPEAQMGFRMAEEGELILLSIPQEKLQQEGWGSTTPIPDQYTLRSTQIAATQQAIGDFNNKLAAAASEHGLAFVDVDAKMETVSNRGLLFDGVQLSTDFVQGGIFSLDGVHLTSRGSAVIVNLLVEAINETYGATLSPVNSADFEGVRFPDP